MESQALREVDLSGAIDKLAFRGHVVLPGAPDYDIHRRVWNGSIDKHPAAIVRCAGVSDVIAAVKLGRDTGVPVAVRSGGHSFPGHSVVDDGLVIDLKLMKGVRVDPEKRTVRVQAGVLLGELDRETQAFGLVVPSGIVSHTGVAGLTLGGGYGWLQRRHGLTIDHLVAVDLVTADGEFVKASADENAELFWGVRGGGGNFGIVTEFEFRCVPLGTHVLAGPMLWPMEQSSEIMRFYRDWVAHAPDELTSVVVHRKAPPLPFIPQELHGRLVLVIDGCWSGDIDEGVKFLEPLKKFRTPLADFCMPKPFLEQQRIIDPAYPAGRWYYFKTCDVAELTDEIIDVTVDHSLRIGSPLTNYPIWHMGGAVARVGDDETAFNGRQAGFTYNIGCMTDTSEGFDEEREWVHGLWSALQPWHVGAYSNFLGDEGSDRVLAAYGPQTLERLRTLKRRYDPTNFFRMNQNIAPD
jgi:hypothetical protein